MTMKLYSEDSIQDIADAIRAKNGSSDTYTVGEMAQAIEDIPSGGGDYLEKRLKNQLASYSSNNVSGVTPKYMFYEAGALKSLSLPNATTIEQYGLYKTGLTSIKATDFPKVFYLGANAVQQSTGLVSVVFPLGRQISNNAFAYDTALTIADFGASGTASFGTQVFIGATNMTTLILRERQFSLANINTFNNTPFASGGTGGTLYVPSDLISTYQSATNWSTIVGYTNNQILPIEGSIYETQYADGTPIE